MLVVWPPLFITFAWPAWQAELSEALKLAGLGSEMALEAAKRLAKGAGAPCPEVLTRKRLQKNSTLDVDIIRYPTFIKYHELILQKKKVIVPSL